jgi:putative two-component system response regulator
LSRPALLIIDHNSATRKLHSKRVDDVCPTNIEVLSASCAEEALGLLHAIRKEQRAVEMVIATQQMPGMSGGRLLEIVNSQFPGVGKILLSDNPSLDEAIYAFNNAAVDKYIPLPWDAEDIKFTITTLFRQREMSRLNERLLADLQVRNTQLTQALQSLEEARHDLERSYIQTVESLAVALEAKDRYTSGHSQRVARFATLIARSMECSAEDVEIINQVALLHDIGKIGMVDAVLNKPTNLTAEERELVKSHPVVGAQILMPVRTFEKHVDGIRYHHEMYDGSGYPDGLRGKDIPLAARVVSLADAFDAMTSTRPYRIGLPLAFAMQEIQKMRGRQFCPDAVDAFLRVLRATGVAAPQASPEGEEPRSPDPTPEDEAAAADQEADGERGDRLDPQSSAA